MGYTEMTLVVPYKFRFEELRLSVFDNRWYEKAGLRRDAISSQVIDALKGAGDKGDQQ
jgi:hypothetical protein